MNLTEAISILTSIDVENISKLDNLPNDVGGLSAAELKATFDKGNVDMKAFLLELIDAIIAGDEAAARGITQLGMPGSMIQDNTITAEKLVSIEGAEAVTEFNIRDGAVTEPKLSAELQSKINNAIETIAANIASIRNINANINNLIASTNSLSINKQNKHKTLTVTLTSGGTSWEVSAPGVTPSNTVLCAPDYNSAEEASNKRVLCSAQRTDYLTFTAKRSTSSSITMNVLILDV